MSSISIPCPHCGKSTTVDLEQRYSSQKCRHCKKFVDGMKTPGKEPEVKRVKVIRKDQGVWADGAAPVARKKVKWPLRLKLLAALTGTVTCALVVVLVSRRQANAGKVVGDAPEVIEEELVSQLQPTWRESALKAAHGAMEAKNVASMLPWISHKGITDKEVQAWHDEFPGELPLAAAVDDQYNLVTGEFAWPVAYFGYTDHEGRPRSFVVHEREEGIQVDWPSLTGHGDMRVADYLGRRPAKPVMLRVRARISHYYNRIFGDESRWVCLRLSDAVGGAVFYGYLNREHPMAKGLAAALPDPEMRRNLPDQALTGRFQFLPGAGEDQAQLVSIAGLTWYFPDGVPAGDGVLPEPKAPDVDPDAATPEAPAAPAPEADK